MLTIFITSLPRLQQIERSCLPNKVLSKTT
jgi:hypothetical protein